MPAFEQGTAPTHEVGTEADSPYGPVEHVTKDIQFPPTGNTPETTLGPKTAEANNGPDVGPKGIPVPGPHPMPSEMTTPPSVPPTPQLPTKDPTAPLPPSPSDY